MTIRIATWNVNGLRSLILDDLMSAKFKKGATKTEIHLDSNLGKLLDQYDPNVICFQETRCDEDTMNRFVIPGWKIYSSSSESQTPSRTGNRYSGTSVWLRDSLGEEPTEIVTRIPTLAEPITEADREGRFMALHFEKWVLINTYVPNAGTNYTYRTERWDPAMLLYLRSLRATGKAIVWVGDLNVAPTPLDVYFGDPTTASHKDAKRLRKIHGGDTPALREAYWDTPAMRGETPDTSPGFTVAERRGFQGFLEEGYVDAWRHQNPERDFSDYSYYSLRIPTCRPNNLGWRIDHVLVDEAHIGCISDCRVLTGVGGDTKTREGVGKYGSDHVPVCCSFNLE